MNRIDRISAILIQLQTKRVIKAQEIADRFSISLRTVYRDIRSLEEAGIPVGSEAGKGYFLAEGYHLPPVMFTKQEAGSMLLAAKLVEKFADAATNEHYKSAMYKVKSVLRNTDKDFIENIDDRIEVLTPQNTPNLPPNNFMYEIQSAIAEKKVLVIQYFSVYKSEHTTREIEPVGIIFYGNNWHLIAFCRLRNGYRDFRLDQIRSIKPNNEVYTLSKNRTLSHYLNDLSGKADLQKAVIRFPKFIKKFLDTQKYYFGFVEESENQDSWDLTFLTTPFEYIGRWLLSYGNSAEIIEPEELKNTMKKLTIELKEHYLS